MMNLRQKLASVRCELKNIEKKGYNEAQSYKFMRAEDVAGDIGDRLAALNIVIGRENLKYQFDVIEVQRRNGMAKDSHVIVTLDYIFLDGDSDEKITVSAIGEGRDSGDKAVPKALTSALKYALTQPLMMRVGDDAEETADHDRDTPAKNDDPFADTPPKKTTTAFPPAAKPSVAFASDVQRTVLWAKVKRAHGDKAESWFKNRCMEMTGAPNSKKLTVEQVVALDEMLTDPAEASQDYVETFQTEAEKRANG